MFKPTGLNWLNSTDFDSAWATDAAYKDGRYYWYLSAGKGRIAVVSSENPDGPFTDAKGEPFYTPTPDVLLNSTGVVPPATGARDPSVLLDDDGSHHLVAAFDGANGVPGLGNCGYFTVQLTEDMTKNASAWTHMDVHDPDGSFGPGYEDDKPFLHVSATRPPPPSASISHLTLVGSRVQKHGGVYYLSWGCFYSTATSLHGPYQFRGSVLDTAHIATDFRVGNETSMPVYAREDYRDRHASFLALHGQTYFFCNDRSHSTDPFYAGAFRDTALDMCITTPTTLLRRSISTARVSGHTMAVV